MTLVIFAFVFWLVSWRMNVVLANSAASETRLIKLVVPLIFGVTILVAWELVVRGLNVPLVILPPPSIIADTFLAKLPILWKDFVQTFVKGALSGYLIGCSAAISLAILVERFDFLRRGLLPVGNFLACLLYTSPSPRDLSTSRMPSSA